MNVVNASALIRSILLQAGDYALAIQNTITVSYKDGEQALTEADLGVSNLVRQRLETHLAWPNHGLIDEEGLNLTPAEAFQTYEYLWVLDPIDGTAGYAMKRRMWGISLALFHQGVPVAGGIYLPGQEELLITGESGSVWEDLRAGTVTPILAEPMPLNSQTFVESYHGPHYAWGDLRQDFAPRAFWVNTPESAVQGIAYALTGRAAAAALPSGFSFWDVAAALALVRGTGYVITHAGNGYEVDSVQFPDFRDNWKLFQSWILAPQGMYDTVVDGLMGFDTE